MQHGADVRAVAVSLTQAFAKVGRAFHVTPQPEPAPDPVVTGLWQGKDRYDELEEQYDFLIYQGDGGSSAWNQRAFRQADQVVFVTRADAPTPPGEIERQLQSEPGFDLKRKHLVVMHRQHGCRADRRRSLAAGARL